MTQVHARHQIFISLLSDVNGKFRGGKKTLVKNTNEMDSNPILITAPSGDQLIGFCQVKSCLCACQLDE